MSQLSQQVEINPGDSVSQAAGASHASSRKSVGSSARLKAMAKRAALAAELASLQEHHELELQEMKLRQQELALRQQQLKLSLATKLKVAEAEEKVYNEYLEGLSHSNVSQVQQDQLPAKSSPNDETLAYPRSTSVNQSPIPREPEVKSMQSPVKPETEVAEFLQKQQRSMMESILLPRVELMTYDGNPLKFWEFWQAFKNSVERTSIDHAAKLHQLYHHCEGEARRVLHPCMVMDPQQGYEHAKFLLHERFGDSFKITEAWMRKVTQGERVRDKMGLRRMADELQACFYTLQAMGQRDELSSQNSILKVIERLPGHLRGRWLKIVSGIRKHYRQPNFDDLVAFVQDVADEENDPVFGQLMDKTQISHSPSHSTKKKEKVYAAASAPPKFTKDCVLCDQKHSLFRCDQFKGMKPEERFKFAQTKKLCFNCLLPGHMSGRCTVNRSCAVPGCKRKHTKFLHIVDQSTSTEVQSVSSNTTEAGGRIALPIVPLRVRAESGDTYIETCALLDSGSTSTFCSEELARRLRVSGGQQNLSLSTLERGNSPTSCMVVSLQVEGTSASCSQAINLPRVFTKRQLNIHPSNMAKREDVRCFSHLDGIAFPKVNSKNIGLLIGQDVPEALLPIEVRSGRPGELYATRTLLGWTLNGPLHSTEEGRVHSTCSFISRDDRLEEQVKKFWSMEGTDHLQGRDKEISMNDKKVIRTWEDNISLQNGHYYLPVPFREDPPDLPNNYTMAEKRLQSLKRRLSRDTSLHDKYCEGIAELLSEGYAEEVPASQVIPEGPVWYLPHHPVMNPNKPGKTRIVYDCAATFKGKSLNTEVMQGPDLINSLVGVLLRFRQYPVAVMADIKAMFHQVRVPQDDRDMLRFLWWEGGNMEQEPKVYRMCVHLFGGTWSPSACSFALKRTSDDNKDTYSAEAVEAVKRSFYVDDCLISTETEGEAMKLADELRSLVQSGGFQLTKWVSNSPRVIESIPMEERAKEIKGLDLSHDVMPVERALGVNWSLEHDTIGYNISPKVKPLTRRGVLSIVSSVYDPCGYASPFVLQAKLILQELTLMKLGWDEPIPPLQCQKWQRWLAELPQMEGFQINRCYKPHDFGTVTDFQLHHFSDASEKAYGTASYLRMMNEEGRVHTSLVFAKSRVAPLKRMTLPRLELMAATLSTHVDQMLRRELDLPISKSQFWTDSTIVLQYVTNDDKRYHTFVANRVATIRRNSEPQQWNHVESSSNPADDISRGLTAETQQTSRRWVEGPEFLRLSEECWPTGPELSRSSLDVDKEVKRDVKPRVHAASSAHSDNVMYKLIASYSSWYKLKRSVAWLLRVIRYLRGEKSIMKQLLTVKELENAEIKIIHHEQGRCFPAEMEALRCKHAEGGAQAKYTGVRKTSPIYKLDAKLEGGLLRVGGRIHRSSLPAETKHPLILPKDSPVSLLVLKHIHETTGHSGRNHMLSLLHQKFWVLGAGAAVRRMTTKCVVCRKQRAKLMQQKMASLPEDRLRPNEPPFTRVGVDYFGPFEVKRGRSLVKRYGVMFTCLAVRAIHLEVAHSLDTDSCIAAIRRFVARRGNVKEMRSDNGTNLVGAEKEMKREIEGWNKAQLNDTMLQKNIQWTFNPPGASHHGGIWERQIRTVRKLLYSLASQQQLSDESLQTLFCEIENIVNSRPITKIASGVDDFEALSPNHLLHLNSKPQLPPTLTEEGDMYARRRWRQTQYLADVFWRRWIKQYLPQLQGRQKWVDPERNLEVGDIVLVADGNLPRNSWQLAKVLRTRPDREGFVRSVEVQTKSGVLVRPITKLCLILEAEE